MAHVVPDLPSTKASPAAYATYYKALVNDYDPVKSGMTAFEDDEMLAALALCTRSSATKVFGVDTGNWNTAANWSPSGVPGAADIVLIGEGCVCTYDVNDTTTELAKVRIDGTLKTEASMDTAMVFDQILVTPLGSLIDGTRANPVAAAKTHQWIIITDNGAIDVAVDTYMQGRGILSIGNVDMWGSTKTHALEVTSYSGPTAGATSLTLASTPSGWLVGDETIICATRWGGTHDASPWELPLENERRTLTSVSGAVLGWTGGLTYSHAGPQGTLGRTDCKAYVINLTRNIRVRPNDTTVPIHHRGLTMQMHNPDGWSARYVEFADLGRTAKHGAFAGRLIYGATPTTAGNPVVISGSPWWNGSAISLGPTFLIKCDVIATGTGTLTIEGTDWNGDAQSETLNYTSGTTYNLLGTKYFLTVASITPSTNVSFEYPGYIAIEASARQRNENGVRNLATGTPVYTSIHNNDNLQGRYPFHWHKMGVTGNILLSPPVLEGCSFHGSPGWLVAQHQTHGIIKKCVGYDAQGAGFVAEDGNETGIWEDCVSCHHRGNHDTSLKGSVTIKDPAREGVAFWYGSRSMHVSRCTGIGVNVAHGFSTRQLVANIVLPSQMDKPTMFRGITAIVPPANVSIEHFDDNQAIAAKLGLLIVKTFPEMTHDVRSVFHRFKAWSCAVGLDASYVGHYSYIDFDILNGNIAGYYTINTLPKNGVILPGNQTDQVFVNPTIEGFRYGIELNHASVTGGDAYLLAGQAGFQIVNPTFIDIEIDNYDGFDEVIVINGTPTTIQDTEYATGDLNSDPVTLTGLSMTAGIITGTKHNEFGTEAFPFGEENNQAVSGTLPTPWLTTHGYRVDGAVKYVLMDEWFSSRLTGDINKTIFAYDVSALNLGSYTNHGATDVDNNTAPVLADFTVSVTRNTNLTVDIVGRASGNSVSYGGCQRPMRTHTIDNGDGTITLVPLADENYTETCYVWVDDINGNTTRATMTINVNKRAMYLGRQDLL